MIKSSVLVFLAVFGLAAPAVAEDASPASTTPAASAPAAPPAQPAATSAPAPLTVYFDVGSSAIRHEDEGVLDQASRAYSEGKPFVMILTAGADRTGAAANNLQLSESRATAVLKGLLARGIPADRFQVLAKGETELAVPTDPGVAELRNRRVEITWR
jgi:outer membrane protein OmpA-like peptidoglycan-associated protein